MFICINICIYIYKFVYIYICIYMYIYMRAETVAGGNRLATAIIYMDNAEEGGETLFTKIDKKVKPLPGDAVLPLH